MELVAVIEIPKGARNKYELDHETGKLWLDRSLFTATQFPADYGFVEGTRSEDGDPLDTLVLLEEPTYPGCHIWIRPVGVFFMSDEAGHDPKLLSVPARDPRWESTRALADLPPFLLEEIAHFFRVYKQIEPGKGTECYGWADARVAAQVTEDALRRERDRSGEGADR